MVIRRADTENISVGREYLTPDQIVEVVDGGLGGNYLSVFPMVGYEKLTPITLENKPDARKWAKMVKHVGKYERGK
jgi:hypothetical protein